MKPWALWIGFALMLQSPPVGNGTISGVIVESTTGAPIENVEVSIDRKGSTTPPFKTIHTITDELGRFEISGLPAGRYRIHWERQGFYAPRNVRGDEIRITTRNGCCRLNVSGRGQWVYANPGIEVDVDGTQATKKLSLSLVSGGVISGRVLDPRGEPLAGGNITALAIFYEYGSPVLQIAGQATTNDRGSFRLWGLEPGKYYIRAESRRDSEGRFTYFPGVPNAGTAGAIAVASGGEFKGADFNIQPVASRILGSVNIVPPSIAGPRRVANGRPQPRNIWYYLVPMDPEAVVDPDAVWNTSYIRSTEDRFELPRVRPGSYMLYAALFPAVTDDGQQPDTIVGRTIVNVGTQDLQNVSIVMESASDMQGRIVVQDGAQRVDKVGVSWRLRAGVFPENESLESWTRSDTEGTFKFSGISGGRYDLIVSDLPTTEGVIDIRQGGRSVFDEGLLADRNSTPVEVIVSRAVGRIEVNAVDGKQQNMKGAVVALVPAKERRMNPNLYHRAKFDAAQGKHVIERIVPGEYTLFAWDNIPDDAEYNTELMKEFEDRGVRVTVRAKETKDIQLAVITVE